MNIFLVQYNNSSEAEKIFLESCFSYAICDYIENHSKIKNGKLEEIAEENFLIEKNGNAKEFIKELIKSKNKKFIRRLNPYLLPYWK